MRRVTIKLIVAVCICIVIAIAAGTGIYYTMGSNNPSSSTLTMRTIDGIQCNTMEQAAFHIHAHLDIFINGAHLTVPPQIGINPDERCLYWLHTHDDSGVIHIESPVTRDFTLGSFFDIWGKTFNNSQLFYKKVDNSNSLSVYANGVKVPTDADYRNVKLNAHDEIAVVYGPLPASEIPLRYEFQQGL
jgi:hypothetical protein